MPLLSIIKLTMASTYNISIEKVESCWNNVRKPIENNGFLGAIVGGTFLGVVSGIGIRYYPQISRSFVDFKTSSWDTTLTGD